MTDLSAVVVNYNSGPYLDRCLESLLECEGAPTEIVVVDNASSDGSEALASEHPRIRLVRNDRNRGFAAAANQGVALTSGAFVLLLNPDAKVTGGSMEAVVKVAEEHPRVGAIGLLVRNPDGSLQPSARKVPSIPEALGHAFVGPFAPDNRWSRAYTMADWDRRSEREVEWVSGSAMLIRREAFDQVGGFDEAYFMYVEDVDLCTRLRSMGWSVLFSPEAEVEHEAGISSRARFRRLAFEHSRSIYRYFARHRARGAATILKPFVRAALWARAMLVSRKDRR